MTARRPVSVVGVGAYGPLGIDALSMTMAARADLLVVRECAFDDKHGVPIGIARAEGLSDALVGVERLLALAAPAAREATERAPAPMPAIIALPGPGRADDASFDAFARDLAARSGAPIDVEASEIVRAGRAGGAVALQRAMDRLGQGVSEILVMGVDSYFHPGVLRDLDQSCRLHSMDAEDGLVPSEGAACVVLTRSVRPARPSLASIVAVEHGLEESITTGAPNIAATMTRIVHDMAALRDAPLPWALSDDTGEVERAEEWALALVREPKLRHARRNRLTRMLGDTGAASGLMALVLAAVFFRTRCAPFDVVLGALHSDGPERGALLVEAAG